MSFLDPFKSFFQSLLSSLQSEYYTIVLVTLGLALAGVAAYFWLWGPALWNNPWFWGVLAVLAVIGLFFAIRYGIPRLRERYFLRRREADYIVAGQDSPEEFQARFTKALQTLRGLPQLKGKDSPLYALPWYLLIGDPTAGKTATLKSTGLFSPLIAVSGDTGTQNCDWWIANSAVVLDTAGRYVVQADKTRDRAEWYRLLRLLRQHREYEPINGMIIAISAETLLTQADDKLRSDASRLRERFEEAIQELGCDFPIYFIITQCDRIEGFSEFFSQLPSRVWQEVVGFVDDSPRTGPASTQPARGDDILQHLQEGLQTIDERLHRFRLSLLDSKLPTNLRQPVFCFPEECKVLWRTVLTFAKPLFSTDPRYHTPLFRGLFLNSALQQGASLSLLRRQLQVTESTAVRVESATPYFLHDLFRTIIPRDRGLVSLTAREKRRRGFARLFGVGTWLTLLLLVAIFFARAYQADQHIIQSVDPTLCRESAPQPPATPAIDEAERCRQTVQQLTELNQQRPRWSTVWFTRSVQFETELRQRYGQYFQTHVLMSLNAVLDRAAFTTDDPFPLLLLVAQRVQLYQRCLSAGCPAPLTADTQPDYLLMLNPYRDRQPPAPELAKLQATYQAYLVWQQTIPSALQIDLGDDQQRLQRLLAKQINLERLLQWVNRRSPPLGYEEYWERPPLVATLATHSISPACTKKIWEQSLAPLLQQLQDAVPTISEQLQAFRQQHLTNCFNEWHNFLADFAQGAERWRGVDRQTLILQRLLTEKSPYQRVLKDAWENLSSWLPTGTERETPPAWVEQLRSYTNAEQKPVYIEALQKIGAQLAEGSLAEASFKLLRDSLIEGKPPTEATNPVQRAWLLATQLTQGTGATPASPDEQMWKSFLEEPIRYVSRLLHEQANMQIQKLWAENVIAQVAGLPPAERVVALYGPGGKVEGFHQQVLSPFLQDSLIPNEKPAVPIDIVKAVDEGKQLSPSLKPDVQYSVQVRIGRRPSIDGLSPLREEQTVLSITCADKTYRVSNRYEQGPSEVTVPWSYQSCGDVSLIIYFNFIELGRQTGRERERLREERPPVNQPPRRVQLTKRYLGPTGFLRFLQDFNAGTRRFAISDFDPDPEAGEALQEGQNFVNVYYSVNVPPPLAKLTAALEANAPSKKPTLKDAPVT